MINWSDSVSETDCKLQVSPGLHKSALPTRPLPEAELLQLLPVAVPVVADSSPR